MEGRLQPGKLWRFFFGNSARAFGSISVLLLVSLAIAPAKDYFSEWRHYQNQYRKLVRGRADAVTLERRSPSGIQQIWIPEQGVTDRCLTCHVALKEPGLADVSTQPFRPHPVMPHKLEQFGCVVCHRGQGAATTVAEAHRSTKAWEQPLLAARYLESSCGQCHLNVLPGTPQLNLGRSLLARYGCVRCHTLRQPDGARMEASDDPPSLAHIADKTTREWIYVWLKNPQAYSVAATMPNFGLRDEEARDISSFLMAQSTPSAPGAQGNARPAAAAGTAGATLYGESFCASCHLTQNAAGKLVGGDLGPELTRIGNKVKPEWLRAWLRDPRTYAPATRMPHYRLGEPQIALLAGYLESKSDPDLMAEVNLPPATSQAVAHGKLLVAEYGCRSCHEINGILKPESFAPVLTRVGSRSLAQLAFAEGVPHTLPDFIDAKIRNPRAFGPGMKMPQFNFAAGQIDALTTALLAQTDRAQTQAAELRIAAAPPSHYEPAGPAGELIRDLGCFSCHKINGRGGDMAPDLTWEGSAVQRKWLEAFLKNPNTLRPALIRRMPRLNLTDAEIRILADYMMTVYQNPAFEGPGLPPQSSTPEMVERGRQLFYSKYACQSCHIADYKKDKGYIGPALAQVGERLNADWIYHWLKDPQSLRPGTIEPNQHLSDDEARALTAFLMSLKGQPRQEASKR